MEITKEYFDKKFGDLDSKFEAIDRKFDAQTKELKAYTREQTEELARMVKHGFDHVNVQLEKIDVREQLRSHDQKFKRLEDALNIKL